MISDICKVIALSLLMASCGSAQSDDKHIEFLNAPDGTVCLVAVQNNEIKGLTCRN